MLRAPLGEHWEGTLGTEFIRHVIEESIRVWYAHAKACATLLKARLGPGSTMAWVLQELCLHKQAEREGVQRAPGMTAVARRVTTKFPRLPPLPPMTTHLHTARALPTQPSRLPVPVGRHPGHCHLVTTPSDGSRQEGDNQVSPNPPLSANDHTLAHGARATHTALPFTCTRG